MTKPPENVLELPLEDRAKMALKAAVEEVIIDHARSGAPMFIWRDGKVIAIPLDELKARAKILQSE
jgi:hypothetical protein